MKNFRELKVWEKVHGLVLDLYKETAGFPVADTYGLTSQIRRATASFPANIPEGCGRGGDAEFARFLQIAMGSASELEYHLLLANDLEMLNKESHLALESRVAEVKRMLATLINKLREGSC